jgi:hypothetical protein
VQVLYRASQRNRPVMSEWGQTRHFEHEQATPLFIQLRTYRCIALADGQLGTVVFAASREVSPERLINAFSKKIENHAHSVALFAMRYNFVCIHKTLRNVLETWEMACH